MPSTVLLTALKAIPWADVITAAPAIVKGARNLFARTRAAETAPPAEVPAGTDPLAQATARIAELEERLARSDQELRQWAGLTESLAEQNAKVVQAVDILRARTRLLLVACCTALGLVLILGVALSYSVFRPG